MPQSFRRLLSFGDAHADDVIVHIARAGGSPKARVLMPSVPGIERELEYLSLEHAAALARSVAEKHGMGLVVIIANRSGLSWQSDWDKWFV